MADPVSVGMRVGIARAYLESDREVLEAIRACPEWAALLLHVSDDIRVHYTAAVVAAVRSVWESRLAVVSAQRETALEALRLARGSR
jgi:hypothetical protein